MLSNLIENRFNGAPRWQIVAPEEIVEVDISYGPYSPQYGGNATNGVVNFYTRQPQEQEIGVQSSLFIQNFSEYSTDDTFVGYRTFASYGNRSGNLSYYGFYQRLENDSHPQSFIRRLDPGVATDETVVTGVQQDLSSYFARSSCVRCYGFY